MAELTSMNGFHHQDVHVVSKVDKFIEDPVEMYLKQMGKIPLLTRAEEIKAAKVIEQSRRQLIGLMCENGLILDSAYAHLIKVSRKELIFDRNIDIRLTQRCKKEEILRRMPSAFLTLRKLIKRNKQDWVFATKKKALRIERKKRWLSCLLYTSPSPRDS